MRRDSIVWLPPDPPPTITTVSLVCSFAVLDLGTTRPTFDLTSFSLALTKILPSLTEAPKDQRESSPGASSISPVQTLKQAEVSAMLEALGKDSAHLRAMDRRLGRRGREHPLNISKRARSSGLGHTFKRSSVLSVSLAGEAGSGKAYMGAESRRCVLAVSHGFGGQKRNLPPVLLLLTTEPFRQKHRQSCCRISDRW